MKYNPLLDSDSYKYSHWLQYEPGTEYVYSYIESRGGKPDFNIFFGLQYFLKEYLSKPFTKYDIDEAEELIVPHGEPFNREGFEYVLNKHGGHWPVRIRAVKEGTKVPFRNVLLDIKNTDKNVPFVTSFLETALLRAIWYPTTVASREFVIFSIIKEFLEKTADAEALNGIGFKHNDFGARGASSYETAMIGGMAHLINFLGSDNVPAMCGLKNYYNSEIPSAYSIPAAEHSTMSSWGGKPGELKAMKNMLDQFAKPGAILAVVSDTYDIWNAIDKYWTEELLDQVKSSGACVVIRPDSGDPVKTPVETVKMLINKVGSRKNSKGYEVLPPYFRVIQGDGVNADNIKQILTALEKEKISADNIAFGMGGEMLQNLNRDTQKFAMKCSSIDINGVKRDVYKDPVTDRGKSSKKGELELVYDGKKFSTERNSEVKWSANKIPALELVWHNGHLLRDQTLDGIRALVHSQV